MSMLLAGRAALRRGLTLWRAERRCHSSALGASTQRTAALNTALIGWVRWWWWRFELPCTVARRAALGRLWAHWATSVRPPTALSNGRLRDLAAAPSFPSCTFRGPS